MKIGISVRREAVRDFDVSSMCGEVGVLEELFEIMRGTADDLVPVEDWKRFVVDESVGGKDARVKWYVWQVDSVFGSMFLHSESSITAARFDD